MTTISRVRVALTGFPGGPGVSTFYSLDGPSLVPPLAAFYSGLAWAFPSDVVAQVENTGDTIDAATGVLNGSWATTAVASSQGTGNQAYAAPVGVMCRWATAEVLDGHRVRGRTFIVPAHGGLFNVLGDVVAGSVVAMQALTAALVTAASPTFVVWHRPLTAEMIAKRGRPGTPHVGAAAIITGSSVSTQAVVLRSRRD